LKVLEKSLNFFPSKLWPPYVSLSAF